ncbi:hypothetical protein Emed_001148 [Eimeria media]
METDEKIPKRQMGKQTHKHGLGPHQPLKANHEQQHLVDAQEKTHEVLARARAAFSPLRQATNQQQQRQQQRQQQQQQQEQEQEQQQQHEQQ